MSLEDLGLTADDDTVYQALTALPSPGYEEPAGAVGLPEQRTGAALRTLTERGLVLRAADGQRYAAAPPAVALGVELADRRERPCRR
ncbi:hypothetical protein P8A21_04595 [Streptomyces poriferorum]|uniref:hypothetical protein n=1 Tax=Streptomyces poriferorum TaxID=2798799 RepID=UPI0027402FB9|nr:hypothetical protein [Streptomyces sp. Alt1]WLQ46825.1 hypothetical protein P8A21_04595 [Streptomyces sp. Alt1]